MGWNNPRRPKVSSKLSYPNPREGGDGDIQVKQTNLGAQLFGKVGGAWYSAPLTSKAGDPVTRIGTNLSNHLSIDRDSVDIFTDGSKVASFGATTTVADINLTGKIVITSTGTQNVCIGTGNADAGNDNIAIGVSAGSALESGGLKNVCIGTQAGEDMTTGDENVCIGPNAGKELTVSSSNTIIGVNSGLVLAGSSVESFMNTIVGAGAGLVVTTGKGNTYIGGSAVASGTSVVNEVVLAGHTGASGVAGSGSNTVLLGNNNTTDVYMAKGADADIHCGGIIMGEDTSIGIADDAERIVFDGSAGDITFLGCTVGIGVTAPDTNLQVDAGIKISGTAPTLTIQGDTNQDASIKLLNSTTLMWTIQNDTVDGGHGAGVNTLAIIDTAGDDGVKMPQGGDAFSDYSDERSKTSLTPIENAVDKLNTLQAVNFKWKYGNEERRTKNNLGLLAQEVNKVFPEAVLSPDESLYKVIDHPIYEGEKRAEGQWSLTRTTLIPVLVKAIQELSAKVDTMQEEINNLK